jgi:hypothetical protein
VSEVIGVHLRCFHQEIAPLNWVASIFTLAAFLIVPFLPDTERSAAGD